MLLPGPGLLIVGQPNSESLLEIMVLSEGLGGKEGSSWREGEFRTADYILGKPIVSCSMQLDTFWLAGQSGLAWQELEKMFACLFPRKSK